MAAPPRQAGRGFAGQPAQRVAGAIRAEAALDQRLAARLDDLLDALPGHHGAQIGLGLALVAVLAAVYLVRRRRT